MYVIGVERLSGDWFGYMFIRLGRILGSRVEVKLLFLFWCYFERLILEVGFG